MPQVVISLLHLYLQQVFLQKFVQLKYFDNDEHWGQIPSVESEIAIIQLLGSEVIAVALHTEGCSKEEALQFQQAYEKRLSIPVLLPVEQGVDKLVPVLLSLIQS